MNELCSVHKIARCTICPPVVSDPDETMDSMVQQASVPTLSTLFKRAKDSGAIKPVTGYGGANQTNPMPS